MGGSRGSWLLVAALCALAAAGQQPPDAPAVHCPSVSSDLPALLKDSQQLLDADRSGPALACFGVALERAAAAGDGPAEAAARFGVAESAFRRGDYNRAGLEAERARSLFEAQGAALETARAQRLLGSTALMKGDRAEARRRYEVALSTFETLSADAERATTLIDLSRGVGLSHDEEIARLDQAIDLARRSNARAVEARARHARSDKLFAAGRFDAAVADLGAAVATFEELGLTRELAYAYVSLGRIYRAHGQPLRAVEYYDRAAAFQEELGDLTGLVQSVNAKAVALGAAGRAEESARAYERALALARQSGSQRLIDFQQGNLAAVYARAGDHRRAIELLEDVIQRESDPYILAYRHGGLARSYGELGQLDRALAHAGRSIALAEQTENRDYLPQALLTRAVLERRMGRVAAGLADARAGIAVIEDVRARLVPLDFMKRGFADVNQSLFGLAVALLDAQGDAQGALVMAEQARARAFLDLLASRELVPAPAAPGPAERRPSGTAADIALGGGASAPGARPPSPEMTLASYGAAAPGSAADIAATAARLKTTLLCYWVGDQELFIWVVPPGQPVRSTRVTVSRTELEKTIAAAVPRPSGADLGALRRLDQWLIEPVAAWLPGPNASVTVVPHGPLFRVSFAALPDASGAYLVERYALAYTPAVSVLDFTARLRARRTGDPKASVLLVADPRPMPAPLEGQRLLPLPATAREVAAIRKSLPPSAVALTGSAASEAAVRSALPGHRVVHLATHGIVLDDDPFDSFLALGATGTDPASDGRLTVRELYDVTLDADLVVLSACRTAVGRWSGDGIAGMVRALFYAGTPAVVATLWDVADEPSARLMADFYRHWTGGVDARDALRQAQLDELRALRSGDLVASTPAGVVRLEEQPFYWAGYVFVGSP